MRAIIVAVCVLLMGCSPNEKGVAGANDLTPVRYVICGSGESNCFVAARFKDMDGCQIHKDWSDMLCDSRTTPGTMTCRQDSGTKIGTAYCTL